MSSWEVELTGDTFDLEDLPAWFSASECAVVKRDTAYLLKSTDFGSCLGAREVRHHAQHLVRTMNGIARLLRANAQNVVVGNLYEITDDGRRNAFLSPGPLVARTKMSCNLTGTRTIEGRETSVPQHNFGDTAIELARGRFRVESVLHILSNDSLSWSQLWLAHEIIQGDGDIAGAILKEADPKGLFSWTANNFEALGIESRHGPMDQQAPRDPMPHADAVALVRSCARRWMDALVSQVSATKESGM